MTTNMPVLIQNNEDCWTAITAYAANPVEADNAISRYLAHDGNSIETLMSCLHHCSDMTDDESFEDFGPLPCQEFINMVLEFMSHVAV